MTSFFTQLQKIAHQAASPQVAMDLGYLAGSLCIQGSDAQELEARREALLRLAQQLPVADKDVSGSDVDLDDAMDQEEDTDTDLPL